MDCSQHSHKEVQYISMCKLLMMLIDKFICNSSIISTAIQVPDINQKDKLNM